MASHPSTDLAPAATGITEPFVVGNRAKVVYGLIPARLFSQKLHRLGSVNLPLAPPEYPLAPGCRPPKRVWKGTQIYLVVEPVSAHPEFTDLRIWRCDHPACAREQWATVEELIAGHPNDEILRKQQETHVYYAALEIPASEDGARAPSAHLLSTDTGGPWEIDK